MGSNSKTRDSVRSMAAASGLSKSAVHRAIGNAKGSKAKATLDSKARWEAARASRQESAAAREKILLKATEGEFVSRKELASELERLGLEFKAKISFLLLDRMPQINAGLGAAEQREKNRPLLDELCGQMQEFSERWGI